MGLLTRVLETYNYVFHDIADPRIEHLPLMGSPFPLFFLLVFYQYFVFNLGPKIMKNRRPFNLDRLLVVYNAIQIVICIYLVWMYIIHCLFVYNVFCEPVDFSYEEIPLRIANHVWIYFILKVVDLLDTVFFVLRKKTSQVTFLHIYHHMGMCILGWIGTKYLPGGHGVFIGFINSIVHAVMYFYYLLAAWDKQYKKNVWWKKYITQLQIVQFVMLVIHFAQLLFQPSCTYPKWTVFAFLPQNFLMIFLFTKFYIKTYVKPKVSPKVVENNNTSSKIQQNGKQKHH